MKRILVVEDERITQTIIISALQAEFEIVCVETIAKAKAVLDKKYDLFILDRNLPDGDGLDLCQTIRQIPMHSSVPIFFLSAKTAEADKVTGLYAGADDYISKPFGLMELRARVHSKFRVMQKKQVCGDLEVVMDSQRVFRQVGDQKNEVHLSRIEYRLLVLFVENMDKVLSRATILDRVWGQELNVTDRVVDTHISNLRKKISDSTLQIEAIYKEGYRLSIGAPKQASA
jgi:two-component system, OmpR family, alkaline phosphatase synthesis response regulator PhoP